LLFWETANFKSAVSFLSRATFFLLSLRKSLSFPAQLPEPDKQLKEKQLEQ